MKTSHSLILGLSVIFCLGFLVCGCESQSDMSYSYEPWPGIHALGYESAREYRRNELSAYRLVITMSKLSELGKVEFLRGFREAYDDVYESELGQQYANILKQSLEGGYFEEGVEQGRKYVNGEATDARIQELISSSAGLSRSSSLGWQAGYISGFAQEMENRKPGYLEEDFYSQAETKYNALRSPLGV